MSYRPPQAAAWALAVLSASPPSMRGMGAVGLRRAHDLAARRGVSERTLRRMVSFFSRHRADKQGRSWLAHGRGWQAWNGWGGDAGEEWARMVLGRLDG